MKKLLLKKKYDERGIAIYIAVVVTAALVLVSYAVVSLAIKEIGSSAAERDSQAAFYAADSGVECAIYWDLKNLSGMSAFSTTTQSPVPTIPAPILCNNLSVPISITVAPAPSGIGTSTFRFSFPPDTYCVDVTVVKSYSGNLPKTKVESRGYNSCSAANTRRVERAILVNY